MRRRAHAGHPKSGRHGVAAAASGTVSTPIGLQVIWSGGCRGVGVIAIGTPAGRLWDPPRAKSKHLVIGSNKYFDIISGSDSCLDSATLIFNKNVLRGPGMADPCKSCASCLFHDAGICPTSKFARECCSTACHQSRPRGTRRVSPIICCRVSLLNLPLHSFSVRGHIKKDSQRLVPPAMGT